MEIIIERPQKQEPVVEMVECKGLGHPDTLCDSLCEECSKALSRHYLKHFGKVLHHNIDKAVLVAGKSVPKFGGGKVIRPVKIILVGRATAKAGKTRIPVKDICMNAAKDYLAQLGFRNYRLSVEVKEGAANLKQVAAKAVANDTSIGVAHYPPTDLELLVKETASLLVSDGFLRRHPYAGKDVKVMGLRTGSKVRLTVAIAFIGRHVRDMDSYRRAKDSVREEIGKTTDAEIAINELDAYDGESSIYLTVTGFSAEMGDDGGAGRGNRFDGLITPNQAMSIESFAGKNINHPGKIYQYMSYEISRALVEQLGLAFAEVKLLTKIGGPLEDPEIVSVAVEGGADDSEIRRVIESQLSQLPEIQKRIAVG